MKRMMLFLLALVICIGLLSGCGDNKDEIPTEEVELWVVTELTDRYGMNDQAERIIEEFTELYPNVTVKLDILPTDEEERAVYLQKIRTQIMGGGGPDVYLMPTRNTVPISTSLNYESKSVEPLFRDVQSVMYNGIFYDISKYYDTDETLEKEALNTSVMDGGVVEGDRYVLPLRYQFGIYAVDPENLKEAGYDESLFASVRNLMSTALENEDADLAGVSMPGWWEYYFSNFVDYESSEVVLTAQEVSEFLKLFQQTALLGWNYGKNASVYSYGYITSDSFFAADGRAVGQTTLFRAMDTVLTARMMGEKIELYPMRDTEGDLNAIIFYYAAVGAGAEYPKLAYEFASMFLSEENQFESYLTNGRYRSKYDGVCEGWPVRTVGSVKAMLEVDLYQLQLQHEAAPQFYGVRAKKILESGIALTDSDVPAVSWQVDEVRFPVIMEASDMLDPTALYTYDNECYTASDADIDAIAREYIENLQLYLDEG